MFVDGGDGVTSAEFLVSVLSPGSFGNFGFRLLVALAFCCCVAVEFFSFFFHIGVLRFPFSPFHFSQPLFEALIFALNSFKSQSP